MANANTSNASSAIAIDSGLRFVPSLMQRGFTLKLHRDGASFSVEPKAKLTDKLREQIKGFREEIITELHCLQNPARQAEMCLEYRGWCAVQSEILGEVVLWLRDEDVPVPSAWRRVVNYTLAELQCLRSVDADEEHLRSVHEVKKMSGGRIIDELFQLELGQTKGRS
jgi:hypothetical protein